MNDFPIIAGEVLFPCLIAIALLIGLAYTVYVWAVKHDENADPDWVFYVHVIATGVILITFVVNGFFYHHFQVLFATVGVYFQ